jgi:hypothetical protein
VDDKLIAKIQTFTLSARALLEQDISEQLEGTYGWLPKGDFAATERYPALKPEADGGLPESRETRERLEKWTTEEAEAGFNAKAARKKLIDEVTFTWLNRLVGFKMLESRSLIRETIGRLWESNGFKRWVTRPENAEDYTRYEEGDLPQNLIGEGPRQTAYRHFLISQCATLAKDVSLLFDPNSLTTRFCPRPLALTALTVLLNQTRDESKEDDPDFSEIWQAGNEEAIGWIYQAFNSEALEAAFAQARQNNTKFAPSDIPAVTQLFTIRWVVRLLVENTLGRIWLEMHPDSRLKDKWTYLALPSAPQKRPLRPVSELSFLDPCCGSMHFGLLAFDLFADMYQEELDRAGAPGWPEVASVESMDDVPKSIIKHNLYGIDLDLRAVQLSALALLVRARTLNNKATYRDADANLACANVEKLSGGKLEQFIKESHFSHPIYERILLKLAERMKDSENLGSLLRLEQDLRRLVEKERKAAEATKQFELAIPGLTEETFETEAGIEEFFGILTEQILRHLDSYVKKSRASGDDEGHFVGEAAKGMRYLRLVSRDYDVVATNPPYLSGRKMNKRMADLMKSEYPEGSGDLYAAFISRCQELLHDSGLMGMLTMHSFMFISSYEKLRDLLRDKIAVETLAHFGGHLFAVGNPGTLQTAAFVLRKEPDAPSRENHTGTYFRLVKETSAEAKRASFETAIEAQRAGNAHPQVFGYLQKDFDAIPGKPWAYWASERIRSIFSSNKSVNNVSKPWVGIQTSNNERFLRYWWEVGLSNIGRNYDSEISFFESGKTWAPHMKGGEYRRWYGNQEYVIKWGSEATEIKAFAEELKSRVKSPPGNGPLRDYPYYFKPGVTWSHTSSTGLGARLLPRGFICNVEAMACHPESNAQSLKILAVLNSNFSNHITHQLNPTVHFGSTETGHIPIPKSFSDEIIEKTTASINLRKDAESTIERAFDFRCPIISLDESISKANDLEALENELNDLLFKSYEINIGDIKIISEDNVRDIDSINADTWGRSWISYAVGIVIGRFAIGEPDGLGRGNFSEEINQQLRDLRAPDGLLVSDSKHPLDITGKSLQALEIMLGEDGAKEVIEAGCGKGDSEAQLRSFLDGDFWAYHMQLYRNRPVYWPLETDTRKASCRYRIWCFHEKLTSDTLFKVQKLASEKMNLLNARVGELQENMRTAGSKKEARNYEKQKEETELFIDTLKAFIKALNDIANGTGDTLTGWERGTGYKPHIDDGVVINAAPLWPLLPKWKQSNKRILKETWEKMAGGDDLDWAEQAMEYWPTRVTETCRRNKSIAIAHGFERMKDEG